LLMTDLDIVKLTTCNLPSPTDLQEADLKGLTNQPHLIDKLRKIITLIERMKVQEQAKREKGAPRERRKVKELAKQQDLRLKKELKEQLQQQQMHDTTMTSSNSNNGDGSSDHYDDDDEEEDSSIEATLRLVRTINTIRCTVPHLLCMLSHPRRNDGDLVIHNETLNSHIRGKAKDKRWCFGLNVYGILGERQLYKIKTDIQKMVSGVFTGLENFMVGGRDLDKTWRTKFPTYVTPSQHQNQKTVGLVAPYPLDALFERDIQKSDVILFNATVCDQAVGPRLQQRQYHNYYQNSIASLHNNLTKIVCRSFPDASLHIYGSCLSDLALGNSSDVDISLHLPAGIEIKQQFAQGHLEASAYEKQIKQFVYKIGQRIRDTGKGAGIVDVEIIVRARVPVIKGKFLYAHNPYTVDGSIHFDLCFLNDIAVVNSSLLREYSLVDPRVKLLMLFVKAWARDGEVNSAADNSLSSYTWMNMVIYYLQCIGIVPNLQDPTLMSQCGVVPNPNNPFHCVDGLSTAFVTWDQVWRGGHWESPLSDPSYSLLKDIPVTALFYGFFDFYLYIFPRASMAVSIRLGANSTMLKTEFENSRFSRLCIEDPFETFDSHCPHDLGSPCGEFGWNHIQNLMEKTEEGLAKFLCHNPKGGNRQPDAVHRIYTMFWPSKPSQSSLMYIARNVNNYQPQHQRRHQPKGKSKAKQKPRHYQQQYSYNNNQNNGGAAW